MIERKGVAVGWWLLSVLAAVVLGWWLAMRTMALRVGQAAAVVAAALPASAGPAKRALATVPLKDRAEDYLTVRELEGYLSLCGKSIRREINEGKLPSHRMRKKLTVKGSDAQAWLLARREGGCNAKNAEGLVSA